MKRFLADALLLLLVLTILSEWKPSTVKQTEIEDKITIFEDQIAKHDALDPMVSQGRLQSIEENKAAQWAQKGSDTIISMLHTSKDIVVSMIEGFFYD